MATLILNFIFKKLVGLLLTACIQHVCAYVTHDKIFYIKLRRNRMETDTCEKILFMSLITLRN